MDLEEAIGRLKHMITVRSIIKLENLIDGDADIEYIKNADAVEIVLQEMERLQKENDLAKKALIANSYEADERNNLLAEVQRQKKENEELKTERDSYRAQVNSAFDNGFIHKDKIREKIEEYKNSKEFYQNFPDDYMGDIAISLLQDLLREE